LQISQTRTGVLISP